MLVNRDSMIDCLRPPRMIRVGESLTEWTMGRLSGASESGTASAARSGATSAKRSGAAVEVAEPSMKSVGSLVNDLARLFKISFDRQSRSLGLTRAQWQLLLHLYRHEGMTQTELATVLELSVPTVGNLVHRLVARDWIEIRVDPAHRLNKYCYLLPTVRPLLTRVHNIAGEVDQQSMQGFSPQEIKKLFNLLARMKRNLGTRGSPVEVAQVSRNGARATGDVARATVSSARTTGSGARTSGSGARAGVRKLNRPSGRSAS